MEPLSHNQNYLYIDTIPLEYSFPHKFSSPQPQVEVDRSTPSPHPTMVKKLNHNASERDRRKKINSLISSLRSLLPVANQTKKMSIPTTISRVVNYIPELKQKLEGLTKKKEELQWRINSPQGDSVNKEFQRKIPHYNSNFVVSTSRLNDNEVAIQISSNEVHMTPLSEILMFLENYGLFLLNVSSSETFGERVFYNLHFQVEKTQRLDSDILTEKLFSIYEKKERIF
ncbi:transcription factor ORG2-like [Gastrolobium bilobum]|uniref:transcription factor ORG2-like n=1 Tax=Gastrolobium bilobum TaxID=150636 RepID=UPI002AB1FCDF|nr:transcription factor ORG2-like [Gastrolobium bilobum]